MKKIRVYQNDTLKIGSSLKLAKDNYNYLTKVLRLKDGFKLEAFNGDGFNYQARFENNSLKILQKTKNTSETKNSIVLAQCLPKGDKMSYIIQKATELGVSVIKPVISSRCVIKLSPEKQKKRQQHWQEVAISASVQCGRSVVPKVEEFVSFEKFVSTTKNSFILLQKSKKTLLSLAKTNNIVFLVGPEGGFSEDEIDLAKKSNIKGLSLTKATLRTETAGLVALSQMALLYQLP